MISSEKTNFSKFLLEFPDQKSLKIWLYRLKYGLFEPAEFQEFLAGLTWDKTSPEGHLLHALACRLKHVLNKEGFAFEYQGFEERLGQPGSQNAPDFEEFVDSLERFLGGETAEGLLIFRVHNIIKNEAYPFDFLKFLTLRSLALNVDFMEKHVSFIKRTIPEWKKEPGAPWMQLFLDNYPILANFLTERPFFEDATLEGSPLGRLLVDSSSPSDTPIHAALTKAGLKEPVPQYFASFLETVGLKRTLLASVRSPSSDTGAVVARADSLRSRQDFFSLLPGLCKIHYSLGSSQQLSALFDSRLFFQKIAVFSQNDDSLFRVCIHQRHPLTANVAFLKGGYLQFGHNPWMNYALATQSISSFLIDEAFHYCQQIENALDAHQKVVGGESGSGEALGVRQKEAGVSQVVVTEGCFARINPELSNSFLLNDSNFQVGFFWFYLNVCQAAGKFIYCLELIKKLKRSLSVSAEESGRSFENSRVFEKLIRSVSEKSQKSAAASASQIDLKSEFTS